MLRYAQWSQLIELFHTGIENEGCILMCFVSPILLHCIHVKGNLTHAFSILHSKRYLVFRVSITYFLALKIGLSIMELQWPEFLITRTFQLHASTLMLFHWKNVEYRVRL